MSGLMGRRLMHYRSISSANNEMRSCDLVVEVHAGVLESAGVVSAIWGLTFFGRMLTVFVIAGGVGRGGRCGAADVLIWRKGTAVLICMVEMCTSSGCRTDNYNGGIGLCALGFSSGSCIIACSLRICVSCHRHWTLNCLRLPSRRLRMWLICAPCGNIRPAWHSR